MRFKSPSLVFLWLFFLGFALPNSARSDESKTPARTLTVYVDEGIGALVGHVFVGLSDGKQIHFSGFFPDAKERYAALVSADGSIHDDAFHHWDVSKTFPLTGDQYFAAQVAVDDWAARAKKGEVRYALLANSCGDYAAAICQAAGVGLGLPWDATKTTRPGNFGAYLRKNGGTLNTLAFEGVWQSGAGKDQTPRQLTITREGSTYLVKDKRFDWKATREKNRLAGEYLPSEAEIKVLWPKNAAQADQVAGKVKIWLSLTMSADGSRLEEEVIGQNWLTDGKGKVTKILGKDDQSTEISFSFERKK